MGLLLSPPSLAAQPEVELVARYLRTEPVVALVEAGRARVEGASAGPALLPNPVLLARYENAPGAATITRVIGAGLDVDLGLVAASKRIAAREAGQREQAQRMTSLLGEVCAFRHDLIDVWAAGGHAAAVATAQERVEELASDLTALAEAGEVAAYDRDRALLAAGTHRVAQQTASGNAASALAQLAVKVGEIDSVGLLPLGPMVELEPLDDAVGAHPQVVAARAQLRAATATSAGARRAAWPELTVSAGLRSDTTTGLQPQAGFELGGALAVPLWDWSRPERKEALSQLATAQSALSTTERDVRAAIAAAHAQAAAFEDAPRSEVDAGAVWRAATALYLGGEETIGTLLAAAGDVEAAQIAAIEGERSQRHARLDLDCAAGRLRPTELQNVLEETLR